MSATDSPNTRDDGLTYVSYEKGTYEGATGTYKGGGNVFIWLHPFVWRDQPNDSDEDEEAWEERATEKEKEKGEASSSSKPKEKEKGAPPQSEKKMKSVPAP